ncbi:MAG: hypothetical protein IJT99_01270 [Clostridia bacterium]|nr:hypothetical protein [Clostridia bacterium]
MNMMSNYGTISNAVCDEVAALPPTTIGELTLETLDMQAETLAMMCKIVSMMWGDECTAAPNKASENLMSRLAAMQENQRAIMNAAKAITEKL